MKEIHVTIDHVKCNGPFPTVTDLDTHTTINDLIPIEHAELIANATIGARFTLDVFGATGRVPAMLHVVDVRRPAAGTPVGILGNWVLPDAPYGDDEVHDTVRAAVAAALPEIPCGACGVFRGTTLRADERSCFVCGWVRR